MFWLLKHSRCACPAQGSFLDADNYKMAFRFTMPGLLSSYAIQSHAFLQLEHTTCYGALPSESNLGPLPSPSEHEPPLNSLARGAEVNF